MDQSSLGTLPTRPKCIYMIVSFPLNQYSVYHSRKGSGCLKECQLMLDSVFDRFIESDSPIPKPTHIMFSMVASTNSKEKTTYRYER